jgi:TonB family protein
MSAIGNYVVAYLINSLWQVPLFVATGWITACILRKLGPTVQHAIWVASLLLAAFVPAAGISNRSLNLNLVSTNQGTHLVSAPAPSQSVYRRGVVTLPSILFYILLSGYSGAVLYLAGRLGWGLYKTSLLVRNAGDVPLTEDTERVWHRCCRVFSAGGATVSFSREVAGPMTFGLKRAVLLIPADFFRNLTNDDLAAVLGHEFAHIERRDFLLNLLYEVIALPVAYHPLTLILKSQIAQTRELICDALAAERVTDSASYAKSLLRLAAMMSERSTANTLHAIGIFDANILEKRIMNLAKKKRHLDQKVKMTLLAAGVLIFGYTCCAAFAFTVDVEQQPNGAVQSPTNPTLGGKVYRIGKDVSAPLLISSVDPAFPASALKHKGKFAGVCVLELTVDPTGMPRDVHIVRSLGPDFDRSAIKAVQQYRFKPALFKGQPVAVALNIETNFNKY